MVEEHAVVVAAAAESFVVVASVRHCYYDDCYYSNTAERYRRDGCRVGKAAGIKFDDTGSVVDFVDVACFAEDHHVVFFAVVPSPPKLLFRPDSFDALCHFSVPSLFRMN